jgi:cellulose biosynthesis protein BcsQ
MDAPVVTFYSYKGGVGRSFAVANIAAILAQWGANVLAVDWDIEAPGLSYYFNGVDSSRGVLDFIQDCQRDNVAPCHDYTSAYSLSSGEGSLSFMPAEGSQATNYRKVVQSLNWDKLYEEHALGSHLEDLRAQWTREFDIVLVDSRTGLTDFSGLTTAQLPDILAFLFTANGQSLGGSKDIVKRAMDARREMSVDRPALLPLPIPARFDQREEYERAQQWRTRFASELTPLLDVWNPRNADIAKLLDLLTIPYQARWTFGEDLAAVLEPAGPSGTRSPSQSVTYALETLAAVIAQRLTKVDLLVSSRDEYVHSARSAVRGWRSRGEGAPKIFFSYSAGDRSVAGQIAAWLRNANFDVWLDEFSLDMSQPTEASVVPAIEDSDGYVVLLAPDSKWQQMEIDTMLRHRLRSDKHKPIVPMIVAGRERELYSSRVSDFQAVPVVRDDLEKTMQHTLSRLLPLQGPGFELAVSSEEG